MRRVTPGMLGGLPATQREREHRRDDRKPIPKTHTQRTSAVGLQVSCWAQPSIERCRSISRSGRLPGAATTDAVTNVVATVGIERPIAPARASTWRADHAAQAIAAAEAAAAK